MKFANRISENWLTCKAFERKAFVLGLVLAAGMSFAACAQTTPTDAYAAAKEHFSKSDFTSVALNGSATLYAGSTREDGSIKLSANADGSYSLQFNSGSRTLEESATALDVHRSCTLTQNGKPLTVPSQNCWLSTSWFFPHMFFAAANERRISHQDGGLDATSQQHLNFAIASGSIKGDAKAQTLLSKWSSADVLVTPNTGLIHELHYATRPDLAPHTSGPIRVVFDDYHNEQGLQIPHHIQRYVNESLQWDIRITSAAVTF